MGAGALVMQGILFVSVSDGNEGPRRSRGGLDWFTQDEFSTGRWWVETLWIGEGHAKALRRQEE
ncbi:MAG: hypothetical protein DWQ34_01475 [Planctomycetota bacterium]|nr:MAG: hypothetical protein DWQ29_11270 [Planctomycetota bacterium]REJ97742.1 MAG: hypothetical protein DWQ34_01475 [Planctomycetota bacterium]REK35697.1 MAG: hypothetical protein DWQ45_11150 [Planctomycetota bacterium]